MSRDVRVSCLEQKQDGANACSLGCRHRQAKGSRKEQECLEEPGSGVTGTVHLSAIVEVSSIHFGRIF